MSLDQTYHALADPSRRAILHRLAGGDALSVSALAAPLPIGLPTVMKHLKVLTRAGLIERTKSGRTVTVSMVPDPMSEALAWLARSTAFWSERLDRFANIVEQEQT
jgi:DNA-binding transcriptional ArsR family regulator